MPIKVYGYALRFDTPLHHGKVKKGALMRDPESNRLYACRNDIPVYFGDYHILGECGPPAGYASVFLRRDGIYSVTTLCQPVDLNALKSCKIGLFAYNIVRNRDGEITDGYIGYININASSNVHPIDEIVQCEPFKEPVILMKNLKIYDFCCWELYLMEFDLYLSFKKICDRYSEALKNGYTINVLHYQACIDILLDSDYNKIMSLYTQVYPMT